MALAVGEILQNHGFAVEYTRTEDVYESPYQKAMEANNAGVDYFVSLHRNSFPTDNKVMGVESLVYDLSGIKYEMAQNINAQLETVGFKNLGVKARPNLVVLRRTKMPAVLVEMGFINSDIDNRLFDDNFDDITYAIANGIMETIDTDTVSETAGENIGSNINAGEQHADYRVQTGLFGNWKNADRLQRELTGQGFPAYTDDSGRYIAVQVGNFHILNDAIRMERKLRDAGYDTLIVS